MISNYAREEFFSSAEASYSRFILVSLFSFKIATSEFDFAMFDNHMYKCNLLQRFEEHGGWVVVKTFERDKVGENVN